MKALGGRAGPGPVNKSEGKVGDAGGATKNLDLNNFFTPSTGAACAYVVRSGPKQNPSRDWSETLWNDHGMLLDQFSNQTVDSGVNSSHF